MPLPLPPPLEPDRMYVSQEFDRLKIWKQAFAGLQLQTFEPPSGNVADKIKAVVGVAISLDDVSEMQLNNNVAKVIEAAKTTHRVSVFSYVYETRSKKWFFWSVLKQTWDPLGPGQFPPLLLKMHQVLLVSFDRPDASDDDLCGALECAGTLKKYLKMV